MAKLYYRFAVMNAGKSTQLLQIAYDYEHNNHLRILCLKPEIDTKADHKIVSRLESGEISRPCDFLIKPSSGWLFDKIKKSNEKSDQAVSVVLIDEAQFLSEENVWDLARVVTYLNIPVICFGLKVDAFGQPFKGSSMLFALAQDIEEVTTRAICRMSDSQKKATMQVRLVDGVPVFQGEQVAIENDADIKYMPVCLQEYVIQRDKQLYNKQGNTL